MVMDCNGLTKKKRRRRKKETPAAVMNMTSVAQTNNYEK